MQPPAVGDVPDLPTYLPKDPSEIAVLSDQPANQKARKVRVCCCMHTCTYMEGRSAHVVPKCRIDVD